ncbi:hypothetical protein L1887_56413 [Cichorium endivia]|nr:hypothetical protein L1887_56413 [Cichorium endivia]
MIDGSAASEWNSSNGEEPHELQWLCQSLLGCFGAGCSLDWVCLVFGPSTSCSSHRTCDVVSYWTSHPANHPIDHRLRRVIVTTMTDSKASSDRELAQHRERHNSYGGNPLAHIHSSDSARLPAFGGAAQPGLYKPPKTQIANPVPLGLAGFAFTTFLA